MSLCWYVRLAAALAAHVPFAAAATLYLCPAPERGGTVLTNLVDESAAQKRLCVEVEVRRSTLDRPLRTWAPTPVHRPEPPQLYVAAEVQRERDQARRSILEEELSTEQQALLAVREQIRKRAQTSPPAGREERQRLEDAFTRHRANIDALKREIARIR